MVNANSLAVNWKSHAETVNEKSPYTNGKNRINRYIFWQESVKSIRVAANFRYS